MKCCIIAIYQYKNFKQKEFSSIVFFDASARFKNFSTYCKGTSHQVAAERIF